MSSGVCWKMGLFFRSKKARVDFKEEDLPSNRREVFFDLFKLRFSTLMNVGLILLLFSLPTIIAGMVKDSFIYSIQTSFAQDEINAEYLSEFSTITNFFYYLARIVCFIVFGIGLAGAMRVIKLIVWGEPLFFRQDFFEGIRSSGKRYALYFFFVGLFDLLARSFMFLEAGSEFVKYIPFGVNIVVLLPPLLFALAECQIYTLKPLQEYKNGFIFYIRTFPKTILATIIICLPMFFDLIGIYVLKNILIAVFIVAVLPLTLTGEFLYFMSVLDEHVNKVHYPTIYKKGIYEKEKKEETS